MIESEPDESIETHSSENWSPGKDTEPKQKPAKKSSKASLRSDITLELPTKSDGIPIEDTPTSKENEIAAENQHSKAV